MKRDKNTEMDMVKMIESLLKQIEAKDDMINALLEHSKELEHTVSTLEQTISKLNDQMSTLQRSLYGTKSEKNKKGKDSDENNDGNNGDSSQNTSETHDSSSQQNETHRNNYKSPRRRDYSDIKPTKTTHIRPDADEIEGARFVKTLVSYRFNYVPARIEKEEIVRYVYEKDGHLIIPQLPYAPETFEKRHLTASLAAGILTNKFQFHLPFERQMTMLSTGDLKLAKTTLHDYAVAGIDALDGLYETIREKVLSDYQCHIDETVQHVVDSKSGHCRNAYDWGFISPNFKVMFFTSAEGSRSKDVLDEQLKDFKGKYIQTDGYAAYKGVGERLGRDIEQIPCMAHVRRKFFDCLTYHKKKAKEALALIDRMFLLERLMRKKQMVKEEIASHRRKYLKTLLDRFKAWLAKQLSSSAFFKDNNIGKAVTYAWDRIDRFYLLLNNGSFELDNNFAERCMRGHTLGRKNYLFCQNAESEVRTCKIYSIIESCKLSGIDPYRYLNYVFSHKPDIGETWENLLPCNINPELIM